MNAKSGMQAAPKEASVLNGQDFVLAHNRCVKALEAAQKRDLVVVRVLDLWMVFEALDSVLGELQSLRGRGGKPSGQGTEGTDQSSVP